MLQHEYVLLIAANSKKLDPKGHTLYEMYEIRRSWGQKTDSFTFRE